MQSLLGLAVTPGALGVHVDADAAPVDLARPQHDQFDQSCGRSPFAVDADKASAASSASGSNRAGFVMRGVIEFSFVVGVVSAVEDTTTPPEM